MPIDADLGAARTEILEEARAELWRYVSRSAKVGRGILFDAIADLAGLRPDAALELGQVHFLASKEVEDLLSLHVPAIFRRIARTTRQEGRVEHEVRGAIDWPGTIGAQSATGWAARVYAFDEPNASEDVPANRVLKVILERITTLSAGSVGVDMRTSTDPGRRWADRARLAGAQATAYLRSPLLSRVAQPRHVSERDVRAAEFDRNRAYDGVVAAHRLYERLVERPTAEALLEVLRERAFEPARDARLYEIWVLSCVSRVVGSLCGRAAEISLLTSTASRGPVYRFQAASGHPVRVYFQSVPRELRDVSIYRDIFEAYEMDVSSRMPDLVVEVGPTAVARRLLIEVKASRDEGYIADGAYKLLGYCADFRGALQPIGDQGPLGLLVVLEGAAAKQNMSRETHLIRIATRHSLERELSDLLAPLAASPPPNAFVTDSPDVHAGA